MKTRRLPPAAPHQADANSAARSEVQRVVAAALNIGTREELALREIGVLRMKAACFSWNIHQDLRLRAGVRCEDVAPGCTVEVAQKTHKLPREDVASSRSPRHISMFPSVLPMEALEKWAEPLTTSDV
jgi:hypothetical protein